MLSLKEYLLLKTNNGSRSIKIQNYGDSQHYYNLLLCLFRYEAILSAEGVKFYAKTIAYCEDTWHIYITPLDIQKNIDL